jgi:hypothetical protein
VVAVQVVAGVVVKTVTVVIIVVTIVVIIVVTIVAIIMAVMAMVVVHMATEAGVVHTAVILHMAHRHRRRKHRLHLPGKRLVYLPGGLLFHQAACRGA